MAWSNYQFLNQFLMILFLVTVRCCFIAYRRSMTFYLVCSTGLDWFQTGLDPLYFLIHYSD